MSRFMYRILCCCNERKMEKLHDGAGNYDAIANLHKTYVGELKKIYLQHGECNDKIEYMKNMKIHQLQKHYRSGFKARKRCDQKSKTVNHFGRCCKRNK